MKIYTDADLMSRLQAHIDTGRTKRSLAKKLGFAESYIGDVFHGRRPITVGLARALGFTRVYVKQEEDTNA